MALASPRIGSSAPLKYGTASMAAIGNSATAISRSAIENCRMFHLACRARVPATAGTCAASTPQRGQAWGFCSVAVVNRGFRAVSYTHLRAHETDSYLVCRLLLE